MPRLQSEYILKGIYLGLLLYVAMNQPPWPYVGMVALSTFCGLALALCITGVVKLRQGHRVRGRPLPFILFLLLESPTLTYVGVLAGTFVGTQLITLRYDDEWLIAKVTGGGALLGLIFGQLVEIKDRRTRLGFCFLLALALVWGGIYLFGYQGKLPFTEIEIGTGLVQQELGESFKVDYTLLGFQILLGIPVFYLLTFAGRAEETEVEAGVLCAALALGLFMLVQQSEHPSLQSMPIILPVLVYLYYTWRTLPRLRVFKYVLRGFNYAQVARYRQALTAFRRALELDPRNKLAQEGKWDVHLKLDVNQLAKDPQLLALVDFDRCIDRVSALLVVAAPTPVRQSEAHRLLNLVLDQRADFRPKVGYWRAVAYTHGGDLDHAVAELEPILSGQDYAHDDPQRLAVLLQAWQLALMLHDGLRQRVGEPQLALPGRRMEAIAAVERHLAQFPDDPEIWNLKRLLYHGVTEADYKDAAGDRTLVPNFDHAFVQQLGLALIRDTQRWPRGVEYLRLAARGLPTMGPSILIAIAQAYDRAGDPDESWHYYEFAKRAGNAVGPANLTEEDRHAFFAVLKMLGDEAIQQGKIDQAIEDYRLYSTYDRSGIETMRTLSNLYLEKEDALSALHFAELGLVYNSSDKDLMERQDKCYYSIQPADLQKRIDTYGGGFDFEYCLRKAKALLDYRDADLEVIDWANHLVQLALATRPNNIRARVLQGRALLRRGEREEAVKLLDDLRVNRPLKFASDEDAESWLTANKILGTVYLEELGKPDLAIQCFQEFRKSARSGADTNYRLGQAWEQLGDKGKAIKCYELVTAYDTHPLARDAQAAIHRLQQG